MKHRFSALLALLLVLSLTACGNPSAPSAPAEDGHTSAVDQLVVAITKDENSLTPFTYVTATGTVVNRLMYDTLFTTDLNNEVIPWMVEDDYTISDGYKTYTFTLIDGQTFQDGTPVTTEDVAFSFTYQRDTSMIESIDIQDARTMTIRLKAGDINFMRTDLVERRILCKAQYEHVADPTTVNDPIGSGMYHLKEYKPGEYYVLEAVENYFRGTPKVRTIQMPIMEDSAAVQTALLSGQIAAATSSIGVEMLDTFSKAKGIEILSGAGYSPMMLNFNNEVAPFSDPVFRSAMTYAIDVNGIMTTLYGDYCTVGTKGIVRPDLPYAVPGLAYTYDPEHANALLDDAGYTMGADGVRIDPSGASCTIEILVYSGSTPRIRAAELAAEQLKKVGVSASVKVMEMDTVDAYVWPDFDVAKGRNYSAAMWGWGTSIRPNFLVTLFSSDPLKGNCNVCGYASNAVDAVINGPYATAASDDALYAALGEIQTQVAQDPGLICFGFADALQACNTAQYDGFRAGKGLNVINIFSFLDMA